MPAEARVSTASSCADCGIRPQTVCSGLSAAQLREVEAIKVRDREFPVGSHLFRQGQELAHAHTLKRGWVMLYELLPDGRRQVHEFCVRGAVVALEPGAGTPAPYSAVALTAVTSCLLPRGEMAAMLERVPAMALSFACLAHRGRDRALRHLVAVARRTARERLAALLLELEGLAVSEAGHGKAEMDGAVTVPVTQEELGDALGLTPVHVNRTLRALREEGLASLHHRRLRILDPVRLAETACRAATPNAIPQ